MLEIFVSLFLLFIFPLEGLGIKGGREVVFYLILLFPVAYTLLSFIKGQTLKGSDLWEQRILGALSFFTILSVFFSANKQTSFEQLLLFFALLFTYFVGKQIPKEKEITFIKVITVITIIYTGFWLLATGFKLFFPASGYNFIFPSFAGHNQLGDFLVIPVTMVMYKLFTGLGGKTPPLQGTKFLRLLKLLMMFICIFLLLILSTSRSAYLTVGTMAILLLMVTKQNIKVTILTITAIITLFFVGVFVTTGYTQKYFKYENNIVNYIAETLNTQYKSVLSGRDKLAGYVLQSTMERGYFGIGAGNFRTISSRFSVNPFQWEDSSHNFLGDILAENGIFTLLASIAFGIYILKKIIQSPTMGGFVLIAIFINAQTNFFHRFYGIQFFAALLMGIISSDERLPHSPEYGLARNDIKGMDPRLRGDDRGRGDERGFIVYCLPFMLLICAHFIINSHLLVLKGNYKLASFLYPLNIDVHEKNPTPFSAYLFPGVSSLQRRIGTTAALERAYYYHPFEGVTLYKDLYSSYLSNGQKLKANSFLNEHLRKVSKIKMPWYPSSTVIRDAAEFCKELYYNKCPYELR